MKGKNEWHYTMKMKICPSNCTDLSPIDQRVTQWIKNKIWKHLQVKTTQIVLLKVILEQSTAKILSWEHLPTLFFFFLLRTALAHYWQTIKAHWFLKSSTGHLITSAGTWVSGISRPLYYPLLTGYPTHWQKRPHWKWDANLIDINAGWRTIWFSYTTW